MDERLTSMLGAEVFVYHSYGWIAGVLNKFDGVYHISACDRNITFLHSDVNYTMGIQIYLK
jgi:hypothetical protein